MSMREEHIPMLLGSLKLYEIIRKLGNDGANDEVREEWDASKQELMQILVKLLIRSRG